MSTDWKAQARKWEQRAKEHAAAARNAERRADAAEHRLAALNSERQSTPPARRTEADLAVVFRAPLTHTGNGRQP